MAAQVLKPQDTLYSNYLGQKEGLLQLNIKGMALDNLGYLNLILIILKIQRPYQMTILEIYYL